MVTAIQDVRMVCQKVCKQGREDIKVKVNVQSGVAIPKVSGIASGVARSLVLAGHLLYASPLTSCSREIV